MTPNGNEYALAAPKDRRATLAGEIYHLKRKLDVTQHALDHIDAAITIFKPGFSSTPFASNGPASAGSCTALSRSILDALRRAGKPAGIDAIVGSLLLAQGHEADAAPALKPRVNSNIHYLHRLGRVKKEGRGMKVL